MPPPLIRIRVVSFGALRDALPEGGECREMADGGSVGALLEQMEQEGIFSETALRGAAVAVNHEYAEKSRTLRDGDEVAILPPVSGGLQGRVELVRERIDAERVVNELKSGAVGAVCVFDGIVRDNSRGRETLHLDYEAYEEMALKQMQWLREQAITQFGVREVSIVHRLGRLHVGGTSVLIVVASAHRAAAFEACRWVIDTLKKTVPIWKREQFADGAVWADGEPFPVDLPGATR
ncbi:MAG TPA: molybdenum cofactor biosynthesis protein MoaE [Acidobacteriaceae bacterium]|jgi:molybdopterin synthase catalytic subunit|nr:molybdenum cofactor biosynthesis protein MoaE [Acidobacteriaceae bacterium]